MISIIDIYYIQLAHHPLVYSHLGLPVKAGDVVDIDLVQTKGSDKKKSQQNHYNSMGTRQIDGYFGTEQFRKLILFKM